MKQGWEIKRLEELAIKLFAGGDKPKVFSEHPTDTLNIPVYANGVSLNGLVGYTDKAIVDKESITISARGTIGFCCIRQTPFVPIVRLITIIPTEEIRTRYLYYALSNATIENNGVAIPQLTIPMIKGIPIPIPPREEQERIVAELDCLSGIIERKREQLQQLDALAQSIFYQMFGDPITNEKGWDVKKLGEVCNKITDGTHDTPERLSSGVKFITGKHIRAGIIDYDNSDYVLKEIHDEIYARCNPEYGDVLYTNIGANLGTAAINVVRYEFSMKNVALLKVKKDIINGYYLQSYLNDEEVKDDIINNFSNGGAQKFLSLKMIAKISIPLPPLVLQQEFADKIEAIEKQKELIKQSITQTEELFNSRMDYYFN